MPVLKLPKRLASELADIDAPCSQFVGDEPEYGWNPAQLGITEVVENRSTGVKRRWVEECELVIRTKDGKLWRAEYDAGLTELQETIPFEYDEPEVTFHQVQTFIKSVTEYRAID